MERGYVAEFEAKLIGKSCLLTRREFDWRIDIDGEFGISVSAPWRIVANGRIALGAGDDGQMFGLPTPLDGEAKAKRLLDGRHIFKAAIDRRTADLTLIFDSDTRLDIFNSSSSYEGWVADWRIGKKQLLIVANGGGDLTIFA
jgi:hypothetical protein